ncbi:hypothetical protein ABQX22_02565 [Xanthomonas sp. WHRI 1810A]|uniref:hypothetical protein n=1 Tax=Xanthomonas sp. WHRI 1810A TaxID=3161565 RepID=UPI0032E8DC86
MHTPSVSNSPHSGQPCVQTAEALYRLDIGASRFERSALKKVHGFTVESGLLRGPSNVLGSLIIVRAETGAFLALIEQPGNSGMLSVDTQGQRRFLPSQEGGRRRSDGVIEVMEKSGRALEVDDDPVVIDVLVGFTRAAVDMVGDPMAYAIAQLETVNLCLRNSLVENLSLELAGVQIVEENYLLTIDVLPTVREVFSSGTEWFAPDIVTAFLHDYEGGAVGIARLNGQYSAQAIYDHKSFRHEVGHNAGGRDPAEHDDDYHYGYDNGRSTTCMAADAGSIPYYSNPDVFDQYGLPLGDPRNANMARVWREAAERMSSYAPPFEGVRMSLAGVTSSATATVDLPASSHQQTVGVSAQSGAVGSTVLVNDPEGETSQLTVVLTASNGLQYPVQLTAWVSTGDGERHPVDRPFSGTDSVLTLEYHAGENPWFPSAMASGPLLLEIRDMDEPAQAIPITVFVSLSGTAPDSLPEPQIKELREDVLYLSDALQGVTARLFAGAFDFQAGDRVTLRCAAQAGSSWETTRVLGEEDAGPDTDISVPIEPVYAWANQQVAIVYRLERPNGVAALSAIARIIVYDADGLPAPKIDSAVDGQLNPIDLLAGVNVRLVANPHMSAADEVQLHWRCAIDRGNYSSPKQAGNPMGMSFQVPADVIAFCLRKEVTVGYSVLRDRVESESELQVFAIAALDEGLPPVQVEHVIDGVMDIDSFVGDPMISVAPWPFMATWQTVTLLGSTVDGPLEPIQSINGVAVTDAQLVSGFSAPISRGWIESAINNGATSIGLILVLGAEPPFPVGIHFSKAIQISLIAGGLAPPMIIAAPDGALDPVNVLENISVEVRASAAMLGNTVVVRWRGSSGIIYTTSPQTGTGDTLQFSIPPQEVIPHDLGKSASVSYFIYEGISDPQESRPAVFDILPFKTADMPQMVVPQASANVLDLSTFTGNANVIVEPWLLIAAGQRVWLTVIDIHGKQEFDLLRGSAVSSSEAARGLNVVFPRAQIESISRGMAFVVLMDVTFDGARSKENAVRFPALTLTVAN